MKDLGKTNILTTNVYTDRLRHGYSFVKIHRWNIKLIQYGNNKGSCCMEEVWARIECFGIWLVKPQEWFYQSCIPWYVYTDMSHALKVMGIHIMVIGT
jgi:hypothetical protein